MDNDVKRSPRLKQNIKGFKDPMCNDMTCLGCNAKPPTLSTKKIRKLSSSLCDNDASLVIDVVLNKKGKTAPVGTVNLDQEANDGYHDDADAAEEN